MVDLGIDGLKEVSRVGKGGTARVYQARNVDGQVVAVKVFAGVWDDDRQRRFEREREAMETLNQVDGVVNLLGHGRTSTGVAYFMMPFYQKGSLQDALDREGPYRWEDAVIYVRSVAEILEETHALGIYHRDLKPANILVSSDNRPMVTDFGITEIDDGRSASTMAAYTPGFCPPEALTRGRKGIDGASCDVYALGATLWSLLTDRQPFVDEGEAGTDPIVLMHRLATEPLPQVASAPVWVNKVVAFATAKKPDQRHLSVGDLIKDLRNEGKLSADQTGLGRNLGSAETVPRLSQAHRLKDKIDCEKADPNAERFNINRKFLVAGLSVLVLLAAATSFFKPWNGPKTAASDTTTATVETIDRPESPEKTVGKPTTLKPTEIVTDSELLSSVEPVLPPGVEASVKDGAVTLTGTVENLKVLSETMLEVAEVDGVRSVQDNMTVRSEQVEMVTVPQVNGESQTEASNTLSAAQFTLRFEYEWSTEVSEGQVIRTDPEAGQSVAEGSRITLIISNGGKEAEVPDVEGMTFERAEAALRSAGFATIVPKRVDASDPNDAGRIVSQNPSAGTSQKTSDPVTLTVGQIPDSPIVQTQE